jgi:hypothetical protein
MNTTEKLERIVAINEEIIERYEFLQENYNKLQAGWREVQAEVETTPADNVEEWKRLSEKVALLRQIEELLEEEKIYINHLKKKKFY